ncbi:7827_t:CDS:2 [Paraglomus occultum]|uniref:7827_t:CDS:1 n=1 Tax=Paraglomus occultum TaxID=144539 RepID=A0A9N9C9N2_9GLOM|nr:7827_t:CDS:2 [Paraglomus occultum]
MPQDFFNSLSQDFSNLLANADEYNVILEVGEAPTSKTFRAHSLVLRARSPYFHTALSSEWARKEGGSTVFKKPNVSPLVFEIILKYMYSGSIALEEVDVKEIINLLIATDELLLKELFDYVEDFILEHEREWVEAHVVYVHRSVYQHESCSKLQDFCLKTICKSPHTVFESEEFFSFEQNLLIPIIERNELQMEEIDVWNKMLQWGIAQSEGLPDNLDEWSETHFATLERNLKRFLPLIRFTQMSGPEFYENVWAYYSILPWEILNEAMRYYCTRTMPATCITIHQPRLISFDSVIIQNNYVAKICDWIDRNDGKPYAYEEVPYKFKLLLRGSRDGFEAETFHTLCDDKGPTIVVLRVRGSEDIIGGYNPLTWKTGEGKMTTQNSFLFSFGNKGVISDAKLARVDRPDYAIRLKDVNHGPCFGDRDLWMKNKFNEHQNCSCEKDDYHDIIYSNSKFSVVEYEVFLIVKK